MTQSTSISGPGNAPGILDGGLNFFDVNVEKVKVDFVDFGGPLG